MVQCSICNNPDLKDIEARVAQGAGQAQVAREYGVDKSALCRHMKSHVGRIIEQVWPAQAALARPVVMIEPPRPREAREPNKLDGYERLIALVDKTERMLENAEITDDKPTVMWAMSEIRKNIEAMLKIYETQERIRAMYVAHEDITAGFALTYLREHHPEALAGLMAQFEVTHG